MTPTVCVGGGDMGGEVAMGGPCPQGASSIADVHEDTSNTFNRGMKEVGAFPEGVSNGLEFEG